MKLIYNIGVVNCVAVPASGHYNNNPMTVYHNSEILQQTDYCRILSDTWMAI